MGWVGAETGCHFHAVEIRFPPVAFGGTVVRFSVFFADWAGVIHVGLPGGVEVVDVEGSGVLGVCHGEVGQG